MMRSALLYALRVKRKELKNALYLETGQRAPEKKFDRMIEISDGEFSTDKH